MKLFIVAALVSVAAAARLEHLERGYLPPDHSHGQAGFSQGSGSNGLGSQSSFGSRSSSFRSFDSNGIDSGSASSRSQFGSAFPGATSNQYLPPNHGSSGSSQFSGSLNGFQHSQSQPQFPPQSSGSFGSSFGSSQYNQNQYGSASSNGQSRYPYNSESQFQASGRQYIAPKSSNTQNIPQQAFDEQTGYHY